MARDRTRILTNRGTLVVNPTAIGEGGSELGFSESGLSVRVNDEYLEEPSDETGAGMATVFYTGGDPLLAITLKEWKDESLAAAFPDRYDATANRIQIPGTLSPGDSMLSRAVVLEFRPDQPLIHETVIAFKAVFVGRSNPIDMSTQKAKKLDLLFRCLPDDSITSEDDQYAYRSLGIALAAQLSIPSA